MSTGCLGCLASTGHPVLVTARRRVDQLRDSIKQVASVLDVTHEVAGLQQEIEPLLGGLGFPAGVLHPLNQRGSFVFPALVGGEVNDKRREAERIPADNGRPDQNRHAMPVLVRVLLVEWSAR